MCSLPVVLQDRPAFRLFSLAQKAGPQIEEDVLVARIQAQDLAEVPFRRGVQGPSFRSSSPRWKRVVGSSGRS